MKNKFIKFCYIYYSIFNIFEFEHLDRKTKSELQPKSKFKSRPKSNNTQASTQVARKRKPVKCVGNKNAKKTKLQDSGNEKSKKDAQIEFADLKMTPLKMYYIPIQILDLERKINTSYLPEIEQNIATSSTDPTKYVTAYTALLHLTETAESVFMKDFYEKFIQLSYSNTGTTFQIKISVSWIIIQ